MHTHVQKIVHSFPPFHISLHLDTCTKIHTPLHIQTHTHIDVSVYLDLFNRSWQSSDFLENATADGTHISEHYLFFNADKSLSLVLFLLISISTSIHVYIHTRLVCLLGVSVLLFLFVHVSSTLALIQSMSVLVEWNGIE